MFNTDVVFKNDIFQLIVAVNEQEASRLDGLFERGIQNNVRDLRLVTGPEIKSIEPNCTVPNFK